MTEQPNTAKCEGTAREWRALEVACWLSIAVHFVAGASMALILSQGLETNTDLAKRCAFIAENKGLWIGAWLTWNLAAFSFVYVASCFRGVHVLNATVCKSLLNYGLCLACAAIACDISAEAVEMGLIPQLAEAVVKNGEAASPALLQFHRMVVLLTGYAANALYTSAVVMFALASRKHYASWISFCAIGTALFGIGISATCLMESISGMFWTNAFCVPFLVSWMGGIALDARARSAVANDVQCANTSGS